MGNIPEVYVEYVRNILEKYEVYMGNMWEMHEVYMDQTHINLDLALNIIGG